MGSHILNDNFIENLFSQHAVEVKSGDSIELAAFFTRRDRRKYAKKKKKLKVIDWSDKSVEGQRRSTRIKYCKIEPKVDVATSSSNKSDENSHETHWSYNQSEVEAPGTYDVVLQSSNEGTCYVINEFEVYSIVWGRVENKHDFWPGLTITEIDSKQEKNRIGYQWIYWFQDHRVSLVPIKQISHFVQNFKEHTKNLNICSSKLYEAVVEAIMLIREFLTSKIYKEDDEILIQWAKDGCPTEKQKNLKIIFPTLPKDIESILNVEISSLTIDKKGRSALTPLQIKILKSVKHDERPIDSICIACIRSYKKEELYDHPYFEFKVCKNCRKKLVAINDVKRKGPDGVHYNCFICAYAGEVFCCTNRISCGRVFCLLCIKNLCDPPCMSSIESKDSWSCFLCQQKQLSRAVITYVGLLSPRKIFILLDPTVISMSALITAVEEQLPLKVHKEGLSVLHLYEKGYGCVEALFDGLSKKLPKMSFNHVVKVKLLHMTDIEKEIVPVNLLIGRLPPYEDDEVDDPFRTAYFYEYYRILVLTKQLNPKQKLFWILEGFQVKRECIEVITKFLEVTYMTVKEFSDSQLWSNFKILEDNNHKR